MRRLIFVRQETEEIIADTMKVEVFRHALADNVLVGSYSTITNQGGLVSTSSLLVKHVLTFTVILQREQRRKNSNSENPDRPFQSIL